MNKPKNTHSYRQLMFKIPVLGYLVKLAWQGATLPVQQDKLYDELASLNDKTLNAEHAIKTELENIQRQQDKTNEEIREKFLVQTSILDQLSDIKHQLLLLSSNTLKSSSGEDTGKSRTTDLLADNHSLDKFYVEFENHFRGSEEEIKKRLLVYIPLFKKYKSDYSKYPVLDIGCGRGEMLGVLKDNKINSIGIDLNISMVEQAKEKGYKAEQAEALSYLMNQKSNSLSAITGFHIAEHIPFDLLVSIFEQCYRVLRPGGFIIFETPNPENTHVGSFSFYYDPSHLHPLPPEVLRFTAENRGFDKVELLRLHPKDPDYQKSKAKLDKYTEEVVDRFFADQDYAVIAYKHS